MRFLEIDSINKPEDRWPEKIRALAHPPKHPEFYADHLRSGDQPNDKTVWKKQSAAAVISKMLEKLPRLHHPSGTLPRAFSDSRF